MGQITAQKVLNHPDFKIMSHKKGVMGWSFSILMFLIYVVYILFIGISPEIFAIPVMDGAATTWGICIGLFVIIFAIVITGIYVHKANGHFEEMIQKVIKEIEEEQHP